MTLLSRRQPTYSYILAWFLTWLFFPAFVAAAAPPSAPISRGPYVQAAGPGTVTVVWRTAWTNINPVLRYGLQPEALTEKVRAKFITVRTALQTNKNLEFPQLDALRTRRNLRLPKLHSAPAGTFQYEARLTGLRPNTRYYYAVCDGERRLTPADESYRFTTYPPVGAAQRVRFWAIGDSGTARKAQWLVYESMLNYTRTQKHPIDLMLHAGDMAYYAGTDNEFQTRFFNVYADLLRHTVCWPTFANHEGGTSKAVSQLGPFFDAYAVPTKGEAGGVPSHHEGFYSFNYGRVHFVSVDSFELRDKAADQMTNWIKADLKEAKKTSDWLIVWFHHAPYTKGSHDSDKEKELVEMRRIYMPLFEEGGVDVVLTGHSHIYERSMLTDGAYGTNTVADGFILDDGDGNPEGDGPYYKSAGLHPHEGTVQVVTGHGGTTLGRKGTMPVMARVYFSHGSTLIDIDGDTLTGTALTAYGDINDRFQIVKRGRVAPVRFPKPWQLTEFKKAEATTEEITHRPPLYPKVLIPREALWQYLAGDQPKGRAWTSVGFTHSAWKVAEAPLGYGHANVKTKLNDMQNKYTVVYLRREFQIEQADRITDLGLLIDYDDAFIAYLNGREVARRGIDRGRGTFIQNIKTHDAKGVEFVPLSNFRSVLRNGLNVLAIEGHNHRPDSGDFIIDATLLSEE